MKSIIQTFVLLGIGLSAYSQFTIIPTTTTTAIVDIVQDADTIVISGVQDYFAKSYDWGDSVIDFSVPGIAGYEIADFHIRDSVYYISTRGGFPDYHHQLLKSTSRGNSWQVIFDTTGISFLTFTMADASWGVLAGLFGQYSHCDINDTEWTTELLFGSQALNSVASASYSDSSMIILTVDGAAIYTIDRGNNWNWGYCNNRIHEDIEYINETTIYSISHYNSGIVSEFSYSLNGGQNFTNIELSANVGDLNNYGTYFDTRIYDMEFITPSHGYIVGYNEDINEGVIFETFDSGQNWTVYSTGFDEVLSSLLILNDSLAFIGGTNGLLVRWNPMIPLTPVGVHVEELDNLQLSIFPNPANETVTINLPINFSSTHFSLRDSLGQQVISLSKTQRIMTISTRGLPDGVYYLTYIGEDSLLTKRLIIQH
ncbi:MAG: T9SS type A sorting domain-containing protein [Flavobacteriales bacterium]|jgi:photosystem II stability/assembly factor-like uncharacterized protein